MEFNYMQVLCPYQSAKGNSVQTWVYPLFGVKFRVLILPWGGWYVHMAHYKTC